VLTGGLVLLAGSVAVLVAVARLRRRVRRAAWLLRRTAAAIGEAERAGRIRANLADTP
jgi:hypothetical protein